MQYLPPPDPAGGLESLNRGTGSLSFYDKVAACTAVEGWFNSFSDLGVINNLYDSNLQGMAAGLNPDML